MNTKGGVPLTTSRYGRLNTATAVKMSHPNGGVADPRVLHATGRGVDGAQTGGGASRALQAAVQPPHDPGHVGAAKPGQVFVDHVGQAVRLGPMAQDVHDRDQQTVIVQRPDDDGIATDPLARAGPDPAGMLQYAVRLHIHLRAVTRVPLPGVESSENSSIMRLTPGSPIPRVPPVLT